jgi:Glycosyl hydrolases family 2, TIM barrel domain
MLKQLTFLLVVGSFFVLPPAALSQSQVMLKKTDGKFQLLRNDQLYEIKGVGGQTNLALLAKLGGNSIRTWNADDLGTVLDEAHSHGLTVCVGFWLGHERHGFSYQNEDAVLKQFDDCLAAVRKHKNHPAVLIWAVGNEAEGAGTNPAVWFAINQIAREIKSIDPHHPTMTVIAELGENEAKIKSIERFCPDVDIIGINSYGGINSVGSRFKQANSSKPYIVTEHGPLGPWECEKTAWGAPIEFSSTEKAKWYADGYRDAVATQTGICLGSYAFLWGSKQETTATWFGMLLADGQRLGATDAMTEAWTGSPPQNKCPEIHSLEFDTTGPWKPGQIIKAKASVSDPDSKQLQYKWILRTDSGTIGAGGDAQPAEKEINDLVKADQLTANVTVPQSGGGYRLFLYAYDDQGGAAVANVPFLVDGKMQSPAAEKTKLPFTVYGDDSQQQTFFPSGYMGNTQAVVMDSECQENPHEGKTCLKVEYKSTDAWGGVLWQSPANDWDGKLPGGLNFTGAIKLEFWARGAKGGEKVNFVLGGVGGSEAYRDTTKAELPDVVLTDKWRKLEFSLEGKDLSRIKTPFGWSLAGQKAPVTFYIDDIRFVAQ